MDTMLKSAQTKPTVINVADVSGRNQHPSDGEFNEHLWYDFPTVEKLAAQLVTRPFRGRTRPGRHLREQREGVHPPARPAAAGRGCHQGETCRGGCGDHRAGAAVSARGGRAGQ